MEVIAYRKLFNPSSRPTLVQPFRHSQPATAPPIFSFHRTSNMLPTNLRVRSFLCLSFALAALLSISHTVIAQGLLIEIRPEYHIRLPRPIIGPGLQPAASTYKIAELEVNAKLTDQIAHVQVSQTFENTGSQPMEAAFVFPLPYDGAIDQLTLLVDGKEYQAKLLSKDDARRRYEEIVRKNRDPALLEWVGTGMFETSVFPIPPGAKRTVTLRYSQICRALPRPHRLPLPAQHRQVHRQPGRQAHHSPHDRKHHADQKRLLRNPRREDRAARQVARRRHLRRHQNHPRRRLPPDVRLRRRQHRRERRQLSAQGRRRWLLPAARQPRDQSGRYETRSPKPSSSPSIAPAA